MSDGDYRLDIDGVTFQPVPASWLQVRSAHDVDSGRPRLFAVSVGAVDEGRSLRVRYAHPDTEEVAAVECAAVVNDEDGKLLPRGLAEDGATWARSLVPPRLCEYDGILRADEARHFDRFWGELLGLDDHGRRPAADGGGRRA